jgi:hypothetical protein
LYEAHTCGEAQQVSVSRILQQGALTGIGCTVYLPGTQTGTSFVEKILRLNLS